MEAFRKFNTVNSTVDYSIIEYNYVETTTGTTKTMQIQVK